MKCKIVHCIRRNDWSYVIFRNVKTKEKYKSTGFNIPENTNLTYEVELEEYNHPTYGKQFKVVSCTEVIESTKESIIEYLGSGAIKGIGIKLAEKIYDFYGNDTLKILDDNIDSLIEVPGISTKKLVSIRESWENTRKSKDLAMFLLPHNFSQKLISTIYSFYKEKSIENIKNNPYMLCSINGVSYSMADGLNENHDAMTDERIFAAAREVIFKNLMNGHVGIEKHVLVKQMINLINNRNFNGNNAWDYIYRLIQLELLTYRKVKIEENVIFYIYLPFVKKMEYDLAELIVNHIEPIELDVSNEELRKIVANCKSNVTADDTQIDAVCTSLVNRISYITGGPGTGKTTTELIIEKAYHYFNPNKKVYFISPSSKAARRMTECTGQEAKTIHNQYSLRVQNDIERIDDESEVNIDDGLVVIDEMTMVGMKLFYQVMEHTKAQIILVGDVNQLPSVEAGAVFRDIISSGLIPGSILKFCHRQDNDSNIPENADKLNNGITDLESHSDFELNFIDNETDIENKAVELFKKYYTAYGILETICISPYKKDGAGTFRMNNLIQEAVNPVMPGEDIIFGSFGMKFHVGDPVIHLQNEEVVGNGDVGIITTIFKSHDEYSMNVQYSQNRNYVYTSQNIDSIMLAYALTIHKCQGSEYECVINCYPKRNFTGLLKRNVLYTGATRAKKYYTFIGSKATFEAAIRDDTIDNRNTLLAYNIKTIYNAKHNIISMNRNEYQQLSLSV